MKYKCYTIGYSGIKIEEFKKILKSRKINCVIDVRSKPYSQYIPEYNSDNLEKNLRKDKILYSNFKKEFGARRIEDEAYSKDGIVNFDKVIELKVFNQGIERLKKGYDKGYNIVLMCSEKDPLECHRFSMVSKGLKNNGFEIIHILEDDTEISNESLEKNMMLKYHPNYMQGNIFENNSTYDEYLEKSYKKINSEIGYSRIKDNIED